MEPYRAYNRGCCSPSAGMYGNGRMAGYNNMSGSKCSGRPDSSDCITPNNNMANARNSSNSASSCGCSNSKQKSGYDDCRDENHHMLHMPVAMGYVPMQSWCKPYEPDVAICQGTIFPELNLIFCGSRGKM